jgi:glycosyltransferase involved in cell wall biosynthesis
VTIRFLLMNAYAVGGTIRATFTTASELAKRHDVEVVSVYRRSDEPSLPLDPAVRLRALTDLRGGGRGLRRRDRLAKSVPSALVHRQDRRYRNFNLLTDVNLLRYLRSVHDGVLVGTRPGINLAIARFARRSVVRVGQDHMNITRYRRRLRAAMVRAYPRLDAVATLTERTAADFRKLLRGRGRVVSLPNAVPNVGAHRAALDGTVVVSAGRLTGQKAFVRLLRVWAKVAPAHPEWELRIFGEGPQREELMQRIEALGIGGSARLMGRTSRLPEELAAASVFAMTSRFEGFPMVLLEAMGTGLPAVAYDCPTGPREIITHSVDGYVVRDGDADAMSEALGELMDDPERRRAFGGAAMEKAARYTPAEISAQWDSLFAELLDAKGGAMAGAHSPPLRQAPGERRVR